jgi:predicted GIY-YIG superfamily endonuclease
MSKKHVYIIVNPSTNYTKIGITDNIKRRLSQLSCASGVELVLYHHTELYERAKLIEKSLHSKFGSRRKKGEYFNIPPELVMENLEFIITNLSKVYNPL